MKNPFLTFALSAGLMVFAGCETMYDMMDSLNKAHTYNSAAIAGGGAEAGKDYITGLTVCEDARAYFSKSSSTQTEKVTVTPGDDKGTGVEWTDDGGIVIPPGVSIEFVNKGYCMDPHLPAPKSGEEIQLVKTSSLLPNKMRGTYKNLMQRAAAGDEEIQSNMQRLVWALRTAGSDDVMATYLTDRQKEILEENASNEYEGIDSFDGFFDKLVDDAKKQLAQTIADVTSVRIGNVTYNAFDLMDPDKGMEKVAAHMDALAAMSKNLPVAKTGFNYGQIENGIYTDIKGGASDAPASGSGWLTFTAKIANSTSQSYTFYPLDYAGQVGSGDDSSAGTFYATSSTSMRQRTTMTVPNSVGASLSSKQCEWQNKTDLTKAIGKKSYKDDLSTKEKIKLIGMAELANAAYRNNDAVPKGYRVLSSAEIDRIGLDSNIFTVDNKSGYIEDALLEREGLGKDKGFGARLLIDEYTGAVVVSYRGSGTPISDSDDWGTNVHQGIGGEPRQYQMAKMLLDSVTRTYESEAIEVVGHSLGGGLATWAVANNQCIDRISAATFNAAGLSPENLMKIDIENLGKATLAIKNVRSNGDPVSAIPATNHIGAMYEVDNNRIKDHGVDGLIVDMKREATNTNFGWFWSLFMD